MLFMIRQSDEEQNKKSQLEEVGKNMGNRPILLF